LKSADKSILLFASLVNILSINENDISNIIPNFNKEEYKAKLDEIRFDKKQDLTKLLKELYSSGMKKGWIK